jgi:hypothetical protein
MKTDLLIQLVETQLKETTNMREKSQDLIRKVVHLYTLQLLKAGNIPQNFLEDVMTDIESEAVEIYRKKTYGFLTLEEYRKNKFRV